MAIHSVCRLGSGPWEETFRETEEVKGSHVTIKLDGLTEAGELRYRVVEGCPLDNNPWVEIRAMAERDGVNRYVGCKMEYSRAKRLSTETQGRIFEVCTTWKPDAPTLMWSCLLVGQGYSGAQGRLAYFYRHGLDPFATDLARAYALYSLADYQGSKEEVASQLTPVQITEAERLIAEGKLELAECETIGEQAEN